MVRQVDNEFLTAEEKAALDEDIVQLFGDDQVSTSVTYTHQGGESIARYTGAITVTSPTTDSIEALRLQPDQKEMEALNIEEATDIWLIREGDLTSAPVIDDYLVVSSVKKYVTAFKLPMPGLFYRVWTVDRGN